MYSSRQPTDPDRMKNMILLFFVLGAVGVLAFLFFVVPAMGGNI